MQTLKGFLSKAWTPSSAAEVAPCAEWAPVATMIGTPATRQLSNAFQALRAEELRLQLLLLGNIRVDDQD
jgi:hypothetical protein